MDDDNSLTTDLPNSLPAGPLAYLATSWTPAASVSALFAQANAKFPGRDKRSDGTIGDARHQAEPTSDHNPDSRGIVHAGDVTHGPYWGSAAMDCRPLVEGIRTRRDPRLRYQIFQGQIMSGATGPAPWVWRSYTGSSKHMEHAHISVNYNLVGENDTSDWFSTAAAPPAAPVQPGAYDGMAVTRATQTALHFVGAEVDGYWGAQTENGVNAIRLAIQGNPAGALGGIKEVQTRVGVFADDLWGPVSQRALVSTIGALQLAWGAKPDGLWGVYTEQVYQAARNANYQP